MQAASQMMHLQLGLREVTCGAGADSDMGTCYLSGRVKKLCESPLARLAAIVTSSQV
jgi:hypothetical protein